MTNVGTAIATSVKVGCYDEIVLDVARSCLEGYTGDYFFFQYSDSVYLLVLPSDDWTYVTTGFFAADNSTVIQIECITSSYTKSNTITGTLIGTEVERFTGSYYTDHETKAYYCTSFTASHIEVTNDSQFLTYGSADNLPHLIEGVQNYAYLQTVLIIGVIVFNLFDRIFKRVY